MRNGLFAFLFWAWSVHFVTHLPWRPYQKM
jgi:hypothetical protein